MNVNSNIISRYDDMLYENRPASLNEFLSKDLSNEETITLNLEDIESYL